MRFEANNKKLCIYYTYQVWFEKNTFGLYIMHRKNKPAMTWSYGKKQWYLNNFLHRINEPAVIYSNGRKEWWKNGKLHRDDGPAVIDSDGKSFTYD